MSQALSLEVATRPPILSAQYLVFNSGDELFALGILCVREIIEYGHVTPVPKMPATLRGVVNLRGAVVPVMDLAARFGKPASTVGRRTCIVIVEVDTEDEPFVIGLIVDAVSAVQEIAAADIEPQPSFGLKIDADFVAGVAKVRGRFVIVLDIHEVVAVHQLGRLVADADPRGAPA